MKNAVAKDLFTPKYSMKVEPSKKREDRKGKNDEIKELIDDINDLTEYEIEVLKNL